MRRRVDSLALLRRCSLVLTVWIAAVQAGCSSSQPQPAPASSSAAATTAEGITATSSQPDSESAAEKATPETVKAAPAKKGREPIYNETANARAEIKAAMERATYSHKRVLVKFGGNWCGWCFKLHDLFHANAEIAALLRSEYELVLVDVNNNRDILQEYDPGGQHGYPWLTVLDSSGKVLVNQDTGSLEIGPKHDPDKVLAFLARWQPDRPDAEQALTAAMEKARAEGKRVLVHIGAPSCGWCHVLDRFLLEQRRLIGLDYIDLKIDTVRATNGQTVADRLRSGHTAGGIPWMVILDADGKQLVTSDGPRGNIGYPSEPHEIEYFVAMLNQSRKNLSDAQVVTLERQLQENAAKRKAAAH